MKGHPIDQLVYQYMFPKPKATDPQSFQGFLQRNLIPEVRQETQSFYGHLDTQEAKYPGLDYVHPTHRIRLSRWAWHRRLFRAFDSLGLTPGEIGRLTQWEGTKWAKEKFEREQGIVIRDTAADGFPDWIEPIDRQSPPRIVARPAAAAAAATAATAPARAPAARSRANLDETDDDDDSRGEGDDDDDDELSSVGIDLNNRLRAQAARREAGETSAVLDEEWEQWLKNAIESGELALLTERMTDDMFRSRSTTPSLIPAALIPSGMLNLARAGQWSDIPEFLQPVLRRTIDAETSRGEGPGLAPANQAFQAASAGVPSLMLQYQQELERQQNQQPQQDQQQQQQQRPSSDAPREILTGGGFSRLNVPWPRRQYSELRLPADGSTSGHRTAETSSG